MTETAQGLASRLEQACRRYGDAVAIVAGNGQAISYARLLETVKAFAARLRSEGVGPGLTVAPFSDNPDVHYLLALALGRIGATVALYPSIDMMAKLGVPIDVAITLPDRPSVLARRNVVFEQSWFRHAGDDSIGPAGGWIVTSSGTTGTPKFYRGGPRSLAAWVGQEAPCYAFSGHDVLVTIPAPAGFGFMLRQMVNQRGGTLVPMRPSPRETLESLRPGRAIAMVTTPALLAEFAQAAEDGTPVPDGVDFVLTSGSAISGALARRAEAALGCVVYNGYGSHETAQAMLSRPAEADIPWGFCGAPMAWSEVRIEGDDGRPLPAGEEGRLAIRADDPFRMDEALVGDFPYDAEGWFHPGDIAFLRPDGDVVVTGRVSEVINASGLKVSPWRYEEMVRQLAGISDVAAFGLRNDLGSEDVGIVVVDGGKTDLDDLKRRVARKTGPIPVFRLFRADALPLTPFGKVDRAKLRETFGKGVGEA